MGGRRERGGGGGRSRQSQKERSNDNKLGKKNWKGRQRRVSPDGTQSSSLKAPASVTPTYEREQTHNLLIIVFAGRSVLFLSIYVICQRQAFVLCQ